MKSLIATLALLLFSTQAFAQFTIFKSDEDFIYNHYYKIKVDPAAEKIQLMQFDTINETFPVPAVPYKRDEHFGGWLRDDSDQSCLNTRAKVLIRDSSTNVTFNSSGCTVQTGKWNDPYTGRRHSSARDIQIDHVVALKNTYMTGGHEWDFSKRCLYANYMGNQFHLLSVNGPENMRKSDHTPNDYIPPNQKYTCQFLKVWLNIKLIWNLRITPQEGDGIKRIASENNCAPETFEVPAAELAAQHQYMQDNANLCSSANMQLVAF